MRAGSPARTAVLESQDPDLLVAASTLLQRAGWHLVCGIDSPGANARAFRIEAPPPAEPTPESQRAFDEALRLLSLPVRGDSTGGSDLALWRTASRGVASAWLPGFCLKAHGVPEPRRD